MSEIELNDIGKDWFQIPCAGCKAGLSIAPGNDMNDLLDLMEWKEIAPSIFACNECKEVA